jgi:SNF2-related domain
MYPYLQVVIISYHMLHALHDTIGAWQWGVVLVDESHALSTATRDTGSKGDRPLTKVALGVIKKAKRAVLLSGTPSLNKPFDLFNQVNLLNCWTLLSLRQFLASITYQLVCTYCAVCGLTHMAHMYK